MTWNNSTSRAPMVVEDVVPKLPVDVAAAPATRPPAVHVRPLVDESLLSGDDEESRVVRAAHKWYEHLIAMWAPGIIEAAHDLGVFALLARAPMTSADVAHAIGSDPQATRVLLEALDAYDLIERQSDPRDPDDLAGAVRYVLPDEAAQCLLGDGLYSLSGKIHYDRRMAWSAWRNFADAVRTGSHDASGAERINQIPEEHFRSLVRGINFWAPPIVNVLAAELERRGWSGSVAARVLDVGCGTGVYSQLLLRRFPAWTATGIDLHSIVGLAQAQSERIGVAPRFQTAVLDFQHDPWDDRFDLVFFANIFHLQSPASAFALMRKARAAVSPQGVVVIVDQIVDEDQDRQSIQNRFFRLFAASMLATGGGDAYTKRQYHAWLLEADLRPVALLDTPMHRILLAEPL